MLHFRLVGELEERREVELFFGHVLPVGALDHRDGRAAVFGEPEQVRAVRQHDRDERVTRGVELPRPNFEGAKRAVPVLGVGVASMLPLRRNDVLICAVTLANAKAGAVCPGEKERECPGDPRARHTRPGVGDDFP